MSDNKKYYYMRLKEDFFDSDEIKIMESMQDGYLFCNILLKLYLLSLKDNGRLVFRGVIPYSPEMIASVTRHQVGTVRQALELFKQMELIEVMDTGAIYMLDIQNYIGQSSTEAERKKQYRQRIADEKTLVLPLSDKCPDKSPPENRDKRIEIRDKENIPPISPQGNDGEKSSLLKRRFADFWSAYPKKVGKGAAEKAWSKIKPDKPTFDAIMQAVEAQKHSDQWHRNNGQYIPNPTTWLNQRRWEDEPGRPAMADTGTDNIFLQMLREEQSPYEP